MEWMEGVAIDREVDPGDPSIFPDTHVYPLHTGTPLYLLGYTSIWRVGSLEYDGLPGTGRV